MTHDQIIGFALVSLAVAGVSSWALTRWRNKKGRASIYATDESTEEVALSFLSTLGGRAKVRRDGMVEMRPPFGARVLVPVVAAVILIGTDLAPLLQSLGISDPTHQTWTYVGLLVLLAGFTIQMNLFQKVTYSDETITCTGVQLKPQKRTLSDLVDIAVHPKRPALVLSFADQERLYIPKFLTGREDFVAFMSTVAAENRAKGLTVPRKGFAESFGF